MIRSLLTLTGWVVPVVLTKYGVHRLCFWNMLFLDFGSLYTIAVDWHDGRFVWVLRALF